jgi:protein gp37
MAKTTEISWCDSTFNPWVGCSKVSPGCAHCYAETLMDTRYGRVKWGNGQPRQRTSESYWKQPLKWDKEAARSLVGWSERHSRSVAQGMPTVFMDALNANKPSRPRVFCASLADWLDDEVPIEWLADLLDLIRRTPNLDWLLLTKRPQNWLGRIEDVADLECYKAREDRRSFAARWFDGEAPANVWIGTTVEDQDRADERIPVLLTIPARVRFLSCEPLLGPVDLAACAPSVIDGDTSNPCVLNAFTGESYHPATCLTAPTATGTADGIHWVICGGESGLKARPMHPDWARSLRDQCKAAGVPLFMKQMEVGGKITDDIASFPDDLRVRQFPKVQP